MEVIVDDSQLSLAIGKKGQNVRLAARLLGWRIDIKSEEEKRQEVLVDHGLSEKLVEKLSEAEIGTVEKLGSMTPEQLEEIPGIGPKMVEKIQTAVISYYDQFEAALASQRQRNCRTPERNRPQKPRQRAPRHRSRRLRARRRRARSSRICRRRAPRALPRTR